MRPFSSARGLRVFIATGVLAAGLAVPTAVLADTTGGAPPLQPAQSRDATVSIDSIVVVGKVVATVEVSFVCQPFDSFDWNTGETVKTTDGSLENGSVTILQAQGRTLDWGSSSVFGRAVCDGTTVNHVSVAVTPAVSPWKKGTAVIGASVYIADRTSFQDSDYASTGPISVRLH